MTAAFFLDFFLNFYVFSHIGFIEMLEDPNGANIEKESVDIVISNCVVNLSPRKDQVIQGVYNLLKEVGEFYLVMYIVIVDYQKKYVNRKY